MKKKEKKTSLIRFREDIIDILDIASEVLKKSGVYVSRNELVNDILEKNIYDSNAKIINYESEMCSFTDIEEINRHIQRRISQYRYRLKKLFEKDNHVDSDGSLYSSGFLCLPGIVEEGSDSNNEDNFFISISKLKVALEMTINEANVPNKIKNIVIEDLANQMCKYVKVNGVFIEMNKNTLETYYKFEEYKTSRKEFENIKNIKIEKYMESESEIIKDVGLYIEDKNGQSIEDAYITDVNCMDEEELLNYLSSCFGIDLRKFELNIEEIIQDEL